jgi:cytidylate kinase
MTLGNFVIAIDGPVAAGKTTVGKLIADKLDALFFDTGVLYRAVAQQVVERGLDPEDRDAVGELAEGIDVELRYPPHVPGRAADVLVNGQDVTDELRSPAVDRALPGVSANPRVRQHLLGQQRQIASGRRIVVVGRDIATVVLPDAEYKYFIEAAPEVRAARRYKELLERGVDVTYEEVRRDLEARDRRDMERETAPLRKADGAIAIDATTRSAAEIADRVVAEVLEAQGCRQVD